MKQVLISPYGETEPNRRMGTSCSYDYCEIYEYIGITVPSPPNPLDFLTSAFDGFI